MFEIVRGNLKTLFILVMPGTDRDDLAPMVVLIAKRSYALIDTTNPSEKIERNSK